MSLPSSYSYFINSLQGVSRRTLRMVPDGSTTAKQNQSVNVSLPNDAIVDLTSLYMVANFKYQNASANTNVIRYVPQPHTLIKSSQFSLNNSVVSGAKNQHYGQIHEALRRCTTGNDHANSRADSYYNVPCANLIGASTSKIFGSGNERCASNTVARKIILKEFGGLQTSPNAPNMDSSIVGNIRLRLDLQGNAPVLMQSDEASADAGALDWQLDDIEFYCDVIQFADQTYDLIMSQMLQQGSLAIPFNEITSSKPLVNTNIRFNASARSLDALGFICLRSDEDTATHVQTTSGAFEASDFAVGLTPNHVRFQCRTSAGANNNAQANMSDSCDRTYYWNVNGVIMPSSGQENMNEASRYTIQTYCGDDVNCQNLLFQDYSNANLVQASGSALTQPASVAPINNEGAKQYRRVNYLDQNAIVVHPLAFAPASESQSRTLSGLNTLGSSSQVQLNLTNFNTSDKVLIFAQSSSVLEVGAGQQVALIE